MFVAAFLISRFGDAIDSWPPILVMLFGVAIGAVFGHLTDSWLTISLALLGGFIGYVIGSVQDRRHAERLRRIAQANGPFAASWRKYVAEHPEDAEDAAVWREWAAEQHEKWVAEHPDEAEDNGLIR
jgi:hypothetical protein